MLGRPGREKDCSLYLVYPVYYGKKRASSSVSDVDFYVIIRKLLDSVLKTLPAFIRWREIQIYRMSHEE
jgi:hypothetical protein